MLNLVKLYNEDDIDAKQMTNYQEINHITQTEPERERAHCGPIPSRLGVVVRPQRGLIFNRTKQRQLEP